MYAATPANDHTVSLVEKPQHKDIACTKSSSFLVNPETGEVLRSNSCDRSSCPACAPKRCLREARRIAWAIGANPRLLVWSVTVSPVPESHASTSKAMSRLLVTLREHGEAGHLWAVEQAGQRHVHALLWTDFDITPYVSTSHKVTVKRVMPTFHDVRRVAEYVTKTVVREGQLRQHLDLNNGHLWHTSGAFWTMGGRFLDRAHVRREHYEYRNG